MLTTYCGGATDTVAFSFDKDFDDEELSFSFPCNDFPFLNRFKLLLGENVFFDKDLKMQIPPLYTRGYLRKWTLTNEKATFEKAVHG